MERSHSCQAKFSRLLGLLEASPWSAWLQRQLDWLSRARSHFDLLTRSVETSQAPEQHAEYTPFAGFGATESSGIGY